MTRKPSLRVAHQKSCARAGRTSTQSVDGLCSCVPRFYAMYRDEKGRTVKMARGTRQHAERQVEMLRRELAGQFLSPTERYWTIETMVYVIRCPALNAVKIGTAQDPRERLKNLQVGCPARLELAMAWPGSVVEEKSLHRRFKHLRLHGEWFSETRDVAAFVQRRALSPVEQCIGLLLAA